MVTFPFINKFLIFLKQKKRQNTFKTNSSVTSLYHCERKSELWVGLDSGHIMIYTDNGEYKKTLFGHERKVNCIRECGENMWSGSSDGNMIVWSIQSNEIVKKIDIQAPVLNFEINKNSIWSVSHTGKLNMWDGSSLNMIHEVSRRVQHGIIYLTILPVIDNGKVIGNNVWVSSSDKIVSVWKILACNAFKEVRNDNE